MSGTNHGDDGRGYEVGRGTAGRKKIIGLIAGVIVGAFVVLLLIWLLASGNDVSQGAPAEHGTVATSVPGTEAS